MYCWFCHWGWRKEIADIYKKYVDLLGNDAPMLYSAGHIVWADENFDSVQICLLNFEDWQNEEYSEYENHLVKQSLIELESLGEDITGWYPDGYEEGSLPKDFPPPANMEFVRI